MPHQDQLLRLIGMLQDPGNDRELLAEIKRHPTVAVRMLRIANSSALSRGEPISSIGSAMQLLGRRQVQRIINVLLFVGQESGALQRNPLFQLACSRGKLAEDLIESDPDATIEERAGAFLAGMLSLVDGLLAQPMHVVLGELQLSPSLNDALLSRQGRLGELLSLIEALELGSNEFVGRTIASMPHLSNKNLMRAQMDAFAWAGELAAG
jgi:EAL and modified HD-GYP domain-containing signal transduction protein